MVSAVAAANPGMRAVVLDISDAISIARVLPELIAAHPGLNVVINNAGIMFGDDLGEPLDDEMLTSIVTTKPARARATELRAHHTSAPAAAGDHHQRHLDARLCAAGFLGSLLGDQGRAALLHAVLASSPGRIDGYRPRDLAVLHADALMGINLTDPRAMPLADHLAETMEALATDEVEVYVERARVRRDALRPDEVGATNRFNDMMNSAPLGVLAIRHGRELRQTPNAPAAETPGKCSCAE